jgi:membrane-associated phospholipid phosphatase
LRGFNESRASFPSGHTTVAFALASAASANARGLGWLTYPLAGVVGLSRISDDKHWTSDVVAGAALGTATGFWVAGRARSPGTGLTILPWAWAGNFGLVAHLDD